MRFLEYSKRLGLRLVGAIALTLAALLLIGGCGDDDDTAGDTGIDDGCTPRYPRILIPSTDAAAADLEACRTDDDTGVLVVNETSSVLRFSTASGAVLQAYLPRATSIAEQVRRETLVSEFSYDPTATVLPGGSLTAEGATAVTLSYDVDLELTAKADLAMAAGALGERYASGRPLALRTAQTCLNAVSGLSSSSVRVDQALRDALSLPTCKTAIDDFFKSVDDPPPQATTWGDELLKSARSVLGPHLDDLIVRGGLRLIT